MNTTAAAERLRARRARYDKSEKGKARHYRYNHGDKGRARNWRYEFTAKGFARRWRYEVSPTRFARELTGLQAQLAVARAELTGALSSLRRDSTRAAGR